MKTFSIFRVQNGWIVQTYCGSQGIDFRDSRDQEETYVFTNTRAMAQFLNARAAE